MLAEAITCLALNLYHEARGEGAEGMRAVGEVTLNRVASPRWPDDVCSVVYQPRQFSWTRHEPGISEPEAWDRAQRIATALLTEPQQPLLDRDVVFYHEAGIRPSWAKRVRLMGRIGNHIFYATPHRD